MPNDLLEPITGLSIENLEKANALPEDVRTGKTFYSGSKELKIGVSPDTSTFAHVWLRSSATIVARFQIFEGNKLVSDVIVNDDHQNTEDTAIFENAGMFKYSWIDTPSRYLHRFTLIFNEKCRIVGRKGLNAGNNEVSINEVRDIGESWYFNYTDQTDVIITKFAE